MNLYAYVGGNPITLIDQEGLFAAEAAKLGGGLMVAPVPGARVVGAVVLGAAAIAAGIDAYNHLMGERKKGETEPYSYPKYVDPGRDCEGNCKPCPPDSPEWEHTHQDGVTNKHKIIWNQDRNHPDCRCYSRRIHSN